MTKEKLFKLNLQMFNEPGADGGAQSGGESGEGTGEGAGETPPSFDDILKNKDYQAEFDRRLNKAINTSKSKWESELPDLIHQELEKQKSYDELSDEEKEKKELDDEREEIKQEWAEINREKLIASIKADLAEKDLPIKVDGFDFAEVFASLGDSEKALQAVNAFKEAYDESIQAEVDKRLVGSVNIPGGNGSPNTMTRSERIAKERNEQETPKTSLWG